MDGCPPPRILLQSWEHLRTLLSTYSPGVPLYGTHIDLENASGVFCCIAMHSILWTDPPLPRQCPAVYGRNSVLGCTWSYRRVHRRGSHVLSECCKVGYLATLAGAHVHRFICSENTGLPSLGDLCREFIAKDHRYYLNVVK